MTAPRAEPRATSAADWGPLPDVTTPPLPAFPIDALPAALREVTLELARVIQIDPAAVATFALGLLSAAAQGYFTVTTTSGHAELVVRMTLIRERPSSLEPLAYPMS